MVTGSAYIPTSMDDTHAIVFDKVDLVYTLLEPAPTSLDPGRVALLEEQVANLQRQLAAAQASQQLGRGHHFPSKYLCRSLTHLTVMASNLLLLLTVTHNVSC